MDPKGIPDIRNFECLIGMNQTEVLINFMFQFENRFAGSADRMPTLESWLGNLGQDYGWRSEIAGLRGIEREAAISERARQALKRMGKYQFAPALTVDETDADRPLYKLIYLSRHPAGIKVFRDAHRGALEAQSIYRSAKKAGVRRQITGMDDMFSQPDMMEPGERSAREIADGEINARKMLHELILNNINGMFWQNLWPQVLEECSITYNSLGMIARDLWSKGDVVVPAWQSDPVKRPKDYFRFLPPSPRP